MKVLVLGACGFIGTNVCKVLQIYGYDFEGVDNFSFGSPKNILPNGLYYETCISELPEIYLNNFDVIVSSYCSNIIFAADRQIETYTNNAINAIKCFSKFKGKIIYLSTSSVYGNASLIPTPEDYAGITKNAYDTSKKIAEIYLQSRGNYTTLRLSNVYGCYQRPENPYSGVVSKFIDSKINNKKSLVYGDGSDTRDYTYVADVVRAIMYSINKPALNAEVNIGTGIETSIIDLCNKIGVNYEVVAPRKIDGITRRCLNIWTAERLLGWKPEITLEEGLVLTENWVRKEYEEGKY